MHERLFGMNHAVGAVLMKNAMATWTSGEWDELWPVTRRAAVFGVVGAAGLERCTARTMRCRSAASHSWFRAGFSVYRRKK